MPKATAKPAPDRSTIRFKSNPAICAEYCTKLELAMQNFAQIDLQNYRETGEK
jgi:hypothetical protein